jgi:hypothetical protein
LVSPRPDRGCLLQGHCSLFTISTLLLQIRRA